MEAITKVKMDTYKGANPKEFLGITLYTADGKEYFIGRTILHNLFYDADEAKNKKFFINDRMAQAITGTARDMAGRGKIWD